MELFTSSEVSKLNHINNHTNDLKFGEKLQALVTGLNNTTKIGTPVNAVKAAMTLTFSGVVSDGETVTINNPSVEGTDVYEFLTDSAQSVSVATNIPVDITANVSKATGTLTIDTQPISGNTMTIGTKVYTFVPVGTDTADGEVSVGADLAGAKLAIVAAINGTDNINTPNDKASAATFVANDCVITALLGGSAGDSIATTETFTAVTNIFTNDLLESGADSLAPSAITALVAAITASDTQGVGAVDGDGDTVVLTADVAGIVGNAIIIGEDTINGVFTGGAVKLAGGVDGTVGTVLETKVDASYFYVCVADNTTAGSNWRRISVGSVY